MMKILLGMVYWLLGAHWAVAQPIALPSDTIKGQSIPAHHVRLEGAGPTDTFGLLKLAQQACMVLGKPVELPPEGTPVVRVTRDEYYTATHLIVFTRERQLLISAESCELFWEETDPSIIVTHPHGACSLNVRTKIALGRCAATHSGPMTPLPERQQEVLGFDSAKNCVRTATQGFGVRSEQCVQPSPEPWRSFKYRAGADRRGILLESVATLLNGNHPLEDIRAVQVRKNITVGRDMLDLAGTQGYRINPGAGSGR